MAPAAKTPPPLPSVVSDSASIRPITPASTSHLDWADDADADDLPDLDDWGSAKPAENAPATALPLPKPAQSRRNLTEAQFAEKKKLQRQKARERRKVKKLASSEAGATPAPPNSKPSLESQLGVQNIVSQIRKLSVNDDGNAAPTPKVVISSPPNTPTHLPPKPPRPSTPAKPTPSSDKLSKPAPAKTLSQSPRSPSLPARPPLPSAPSSAPPSNTIPPRRKPFGGEPAFNMGGKPRDSKGHISDDLRAGRRERPSSAHSASRPVISQSALSQLTKSLSGGNRAHRPTVTAE